MGEDEVPYGQQRFEAQSGTRARTAVGQLGSFSNLAGTVNAGGTPSGSASVGTSPGVSTSNGEDDLSDWERFIDTGLHERGLAEDQAYADAYTSMRSYIDQLPKSAELTKLLNEYKAKPAKKGINPWIAAIAALGNPQLTMKTVEDRGREAMAENKLNEDKIEKLTDLIRQRDESIQTALAKLGMDIEEKKLGGRLQRETQRYSDKSKIQFERLKSERAQKRAEVAASNALQRYKLKASADQFKALQNALYRNLLSKDPFTGQVTVTPTEVLQAALEAGISVSGALQAATGASGGGGGTVARGNIIDPGVTP